MLFYSKKKKQTVMYFLTKAKKKKSNVSFIMKQKKEIKRNRIFNILSLIEKIPEFSTFEIL